MRSVPRSLAASSPILARERLAMKMLDLVSEKVGLLSSVRYTTGDKSRVPSLASILAKAFFLWVLSHCSIAAQLRSAIGFVQAARHLVRKSVSAKNSRTLIKDTPGVSVMTVSTFAKTKLL